MEKESKERRECEWCGGTGYAGYGRIENDCRYCNGFGVVDAKREGVKTDSFVDLEKVKLEMLQEKIESGIEVLEADYRKQWVEVCFSKPLLEELLMLVEQQKPNKVIKTKTLSQACPTCKTSVNWKYCSGCGQKLRY